MKLTSVERIGRSQLIPVFGGPDGRPTNGRSPRSWPVPVADHARNLPGAGVVLPDVEEASFANWLGRVVTRMVEAMDADLQRSVVANRVNFERARNELSPHL